MSKSPNNEHGQKYIDSATGMIKSAISLRQLFVKIYGFDPSRGELQQFRNRLNPTRANPGADVLGICIENIPELHGKTLAEFFGIRTNQVASADPKSPRS